MNALVLLSLLTLVSADTNVKLSEGELVGIIIGSITITCMFVGCVLFYLIFEFVTRSRSCCDCCCKETYRPPVDSKPNIIIYPSRPSNEPKQISGVEVEVEAEAEAEADVKAEINEV
jgi:hypothetical protein